MEAILLLVLIIILVIGFRKQLDEYATKKSLEHLKAIYAEKDEEVHGHSAYAIVNELLKKK